MQLIAVYTTVASVDDARRIARTLVERKLAACAQIAPIESFYAWKGAVQNEAEFRILFKTSAARYAAVETAIRELHPYELPAIHAVALAQVYEPYAAWVAQGIREDHR
jgi:periplasmic divalent cation tolerance protein